MSKFYFHAFINFFSYSILTEQEIDKHLTAIAEKD